LVFPTAEGTDSACLGDAGTEEQCAAATINLARAGKVWITATYEFESDPGTTYENGTLKLKVDGAIVEQHTVGDDASLNHYPMPIQDLATLSAGSHQITLTFQEANGAEDVDVYKTHIVAVKVSA